MMTSMLTGTRRAAIRLREYATTCTNGHRAYTRFAGNIRLPLVQRCSGQGCRAVALVVQTAPLDECQEAPPKGA